MSHSSSRWLRRVALLLLASATAGFTGCASTGGIVQLTPDTYQVTVKGGNGSVLKEPDYKAKAISQAMDFAAAQGKVAVPVSIEAHSYGLFDDLVTVDYHFKLVDKNDPRFRRNAPKVEAESKPNLYLELDKLDDLRRRGVITQAEFASQRQKLLEQTK